MYPQDSPFDLDDESTFHRWRDHKLQDYPVNLQQLVVDIGDPRKLTAAEHGALLDRIRKTNMAIYSSALGSDPDKDLIRSLGLQFGLDRLDHNMCADNDAISSLQVQSDALHQGYIPYSNKPIAWHTDGYYNDLDHQIRGLILHCVNPAAEGGANRLLDHELVYLQLRITDPGYVRALMHPEAMTIPPNRVDGKEIRPSRTGPVFLVQPDGRLHMRYTDRSRSIVWRDDPLTREAVDALKSLLRQPSPYVFEARLISGQGLICNNLLHTRSRFQDGERQRLLYRARYFDRIANC